MLPLLKKIGLWVLRALVAALFIFAAFMKLSGNPQMVAEFDVVGLGQWFRLFTGLLEVVGGALVLVPALSPFAAILLLAVDAGAFVAQATVLHGDVVHTIVIGLFIALLIYVQKAKVLALLGKA